jgi:hypothetical protein
MKKINQISTKQSNKNSYYRIAVKYDCPYIAQRNGGNREVDSHLSLKCAQQRLLEMFNVGGMKSKRIARTELSSYNKLCTWYTASQTTKTALFYTMG